MILNMSKCHYRYLLYIIIVISSMYHIIYTGQDRVNIDQYVPPNPRQYPSILFVSVAFKLFDQHLNCYENRKLTYDIRLLHQLINRRYIELLYFLPRFFLSTFFLFAIRSSSASKSAAIESAIAAASESTVDCAFV
jgi:hypothetical protein